MQSAQDSWSGTLRRQPFAGGLEHRFGRFTSRMSVMGSIGRSDSVQALRRWIIIDTHGEVASRSVAAQRDSALSSLLKLGN
jgi:hypothetical protein